MASLVKTYKGDLTTFIAGKILEFIKNRAKSGSQGTAASPVTGTDPMVPGPGGFGGSGGRGGIDPEIVTSTPFDGLVRKPSITNTARQVGIVVHDQKLGNFLAAVSVSLSSSFNNINQKLNETDDGITATKDGIDKTYKKLEQHSDSLESKLDAIIEALRYSGQVEREKRDQREADTKIAQQREEVDLSNTNRILMQDMDRQEIRDLQRENLADDIADDAADQNEADMMDDLPQLAEGGIVSGPDSGYLAVLHGDEAVIPLDNNYTQGQPSAVGKTPISEMPMMAERGINPGENLPSMKPEFTPNIASSTPMISRSPSSKSGSGDLLAKAIELPTKAAGLVTMGIMGKVLQSVGFPPSIIANMKSITSPIAQAFGIPDVMSNNMASDIESGQRISQERSDFKGRSQENKEKGLFGRFKDWITGNGGSSYGRGGSLYGRGGSTVYNRVSGTGGGIAFFGGKKKEKVFKSKQDFGTILRSTATKDAYMVINGFGDPERFKKKYGLTAEEFMALPDYPTDQSSLDSNVFTKSVAYDNAFDYYNSPEYGLKTSEIAYNMSMADEVNNMIDGLTDPQNQVVMNNTNNSSAGKQIEYSAIAVRGNPLKEGTYVSPYSV